ncbi:MAG TPA: phytoene desaturase family protein [Blastocatellia bacterium]|nr:phytoene desaturase family protein [Blastocatellia bacterium]
MANHPNQSAIIIGAGLGGLSAAIHLRLAGFDVTVFEANEKVGGRANVIEKQGFRFDTGPSLLNYPWVFRKLFETAGRRMEDYVELLPVDPSVAFQWEDGTHFQLSSNFTKLADECERLEPGSRTGLLSFLQDAGQKYQLSFEKLVTHNQDNPIKWIGQLSPGEIAKLGVWRSLDSELKRFFKSRYIREALGSYGMYLGGSPFDLPGLFTILSYGELAYGLWLPKGGIYGLVEGIEKLAIELGVKIHTGCPVRKIVVSNQQVEGVELITGETYLSSIVVSNVDVPTTNSKLLEEKNKPSFAPPKMTPGVITYYWGIKGKVDGIGHHTIFLPNDYKGAFDELFGQKRIPEQLPFYISIPSETDASLAPVGDTAAFVLVPTPLLSDLRGINWEQTTRSLKEKVIRRLQNHGVKLSVDQIVFEEIFTPEDWERQFGLYNGSAFGGAHTLFQVGPFRPRNYSKAISGLYYTGASTTPGTGMPMVILSGKLTAERVIERVRKG